MGNKKDSLDDDGSGVNLPLVCLVLVVLLVVGLGSFSINTEVSFANLKQEAQNMVKNVEAKINSIQLRGLKKESPVMEALMIQRTINRCSNAVEMRDEEGSIILCLKEDDFARIFNSGVAIEKVKYSYVSTIFGSSEITIYKEGSMESDNIIKLTDYRTVSE